MSVSIAKTQILAQIMESANKRKGSLESLDEHLNQATEMWMKLNHILLWVHKTEELWQSLDSEVKSLIDPELHVVLDHTRTVRQRIERALEDSHEVHGGGRQRFGIKHLAALLNNKPAE